MPIPTSTHLRPGTPVSIILKADQPTGRQVQGTIADILTNSPNHPRGIKVRLTDGRIGRVQHTVQGELVSASAEELQKDLAAQEVARGSALPGGRGGRGGYRSHRLQSRYMDVREEEGLEEPEAEMDLMAFVKVKKIKGKGKGKEKRRGNVGGKGAEEGADGGEVATTAAASGTETAAATCPVCGQFEGDEAAVAHHVEQHFADG